DGPSAVALGHGVMLAGRLVIVSVIPGVIFYCVFGSRPAEGPSHAGSAVAFVDFAMTGGARGGFDETCVLAGNEEPLEKECGDCCDRGEKQDGQGSHAASSRLT